MLVLSQPPPFQQRGDEQIKSETDVLQSSSILKRAHLMNLVYLVHRGKDLAKVIDTIQKSGVTSSFRTTSDFCCNEGCVSPCSVFGELPIVSSLEKIS